MPPKLILLDTDIGTDVDDCLALALVLASGELRLAAVTTVYGDTLLHARMVMKLLAPARGGRDARSQSARRSRCSAWRRCTGRGTRGGGYWRRRMRRANRPPNAPPGSSHGWSWRAPARSPWSPSGR